MKLTKLVLEAEALLLIITWHDDIIIIFKAPKLGITPVTLRMPPIDTYEADHACHTLI